MRRRRRARRRTQLERRNETQAAILRASVDLLTEHGYAGFSASRVAARAGVSRGAQEHYFPKKNDLIAAATRFAMQEAVNHAQLLARSATRSKHPIDKFLKDSAHFFFTPTYQAMIEIMIAARSNRAMARAVHPVVQEARGVLNGIWIDTLDAAGYPRRKAQQFIELTHYLLRGLFFVTNWLPYDVDRGAVIAAWRHLSPAVLERTGPRRTQVGRGRRMHVKRRSRVNPRSARRLRRPRST